MKREDLDYQLNFLSKLFDTATKSGKELIEQYNELILFDFLVASFLIQTLSTEQQSILIQFHKLEEQSCHSQVSQCGAENEEYN